MSQPSKALEVFKRKCQTSPRSALNLIPRDIEHEFPPITHFLPKDLWDEINGLSREVPRPILKRESPVMFMDQRQLMNATSLQEFFASQNREGELPTIQNNMHPQNESEMQHFNDSTQLSNMSLPIFIYSFHSHKPTQCIVAEPIIKNNIFLGFRIPYIHENIFNNLNQLNFPHIEIELFDEKFGSQFPAIYIQKNPRIKTFMRPMSASTQNHINNNVPLNHPPQNLVNPTMGVSSLQMPLNSDFNANFEKLHILEKPDFNQMNNTAFTQNRNFLNNIPLNYPPQNIVNPTMGLSSLQITPNSDLLQMTPNSDLLQMTPNSDLLQMTPNSDLLQMTPNSDLLQMTPNSDFNANFKKLYISENSNFIPMNNTAFKQNHNIISNIPLIYPLQNIVNQTIGPSSLQMTPNPDLNTHFENLHISENPNFIQMNNTAFTQNRNIINNIPLNYPPQNIINPAMDSSSLLMAPNTDFNENFKKLHILENPNCIQMNNTAFPQNHNSINNDPSNYPPQNIVNPMMETPSSLQMAPHPNFMTNPNFNQNDTAFIQNHNIINNIPLNYLPQPMVNPTMDSSSLHMAPLSNFIANFNQMNNTAYTQNYSIINNIPLNYLPQNMVNPTMSSSSLEMTPQPNFIANFEKLHIPGHPNFNQNDTAFIQNHNIINNIPLNYLPQPMVNPVMDSSSLHMAPLSNFIANSNHMNNLMHNTAYTQNHNIINNMPLNYLPQNVVNPTMSSSSLQMTPQPNFIANFEKPHISENSNLNKLMNNTNCGQGQNDGCQEGQIYETQDTGPLETNGFASKYLHNGNYNDAFQDIQTTENPAIDNITPTIYDINPQLHLPQQPTMQFNGFNLPNGHLNGLPPTYINENAEFNQMNGTLLHANEVLPKTTSMPLQFIGNCNNGRMVNMLPYPTMINKNINETLMNTPPPHQMMNAFNNISIHANPYYHLSETEPKNVPPPPGFTQINGRINNNIFPNQNLPQPPTFNQINHELDGKNIVPPPGLLHLNGEFNVINSEYGNGNNQFPKGVVPPCPAFGKENGEMPTQYMPPYPGPNENPMDSSVNQTHDLLTNLPTTYVLVNPDVTGAYGFCHVFPVTRSHTFHPGMNNVNGKTENFHSTTENPENHMMPDTNRFVPSTPIAPPTNMEYQNFMVTHNQNVQMYGMSRKPQAHQNMQPTTLFQGNLRTHQTS